MRKSEHLLDPPHHLDQTACMPAHTFDTPIGPFCLEWANDRLLSAQLRESDFPVVKPSLPPPAWLLDLARRLQAHLTGQLQDFSAEPYAFETVTPFQAEVYREALRVPAGETLAYGQLAVAMGRPRTDSRAVGTALGRNPWLILVPCHRFISARGHLTGFSAPGGIATKLQLLQIEGALLPAN